MDYDSGDLSIDRLDGFSICGHDVNLFYPAGKALESKLQYGQDSSKLEEVSVIYTNHPSESCGCYSIRKDVKVKTEVVADARLHGNTSMSRISVTSCTKTTFHS